MTTTTRETPREAAERLVKWSRIEKEQRRGHVRVDSNVILVFGVLVPVPVATDARVLGKEIRRAVQLAIENGELR